MNDDGGDELVPAAPGKPLAGPRRVREVIPAAPGKPLAGPRRVREVIPAAPGKPCEQELEEKNAENARLKERVAELEERVADLEGQLAAAKSPYRLQPWEGPYKRPGGPGFRP